MTTTLTLEAAWDALGQAIEARLSAAVAGAGLITEMGRYQLGTGGKRLRALIPPWLCGNLGGDAHAAIDLGVGLELVHNATLVHDDLQDGDVLRRGVPTVWRRYGEAQAINLGDALYFQGLAAIGRAPAGARVTPWVLPSMVRVVVGQSMEFQLQLPSGHEHALPTTPEAYEAMARGKTGALFAACFVAGTAAAGADEVDVAAAARWGEDAGFIFQVQDDLLDLIGEKGRDQRGSDLAEGKISWPVAWAYAHGDPALVARLRAIVGAPREATTPDMVTEGLTLLNDIGAIEAAANALRTQRDALAASPVAAAAPGLVDRFLAPVAHAL